MGRVRQEYPDVVSRTSVGSSPPFTLLAFLCVLAAAAVLRQGLIISPTGSQLTM